MLLIVLIFMVLLAGVVFWLGSAMTSGQQQEPEGMSPVEMLDRLLAELEDERNLLRTRFSENIVLRKRLEREREAWLEEIVELELNMSVFEAQGRDDDVRELEKQIDTRLESVSHNDALLSDLGETIARLKTRLVSVDARIREARVKKARATSGSTASPAGFEASRERVDQLFDRFDDFG